MCRILKFEYAFKNIKIERRVIHLGDGSGVAFSGDIRAGVAQSAISFLR